MKSFKLLKLFTRTTPFRTAIPERAIKPTPADTLKGIPLMSRPKTPPTRAIGTQRKTKRVSSIFLNAA